jgi:hypothetical protein
VPFPTDGWPLISALTDGWPLIWPPLAPDFRHLRFLQLSRNATDAVRFFGVRAKFHLSRRLPVFPAPPLGTMDEHRWARIGGDVNPGFALIVLVLILSAAVLVLETTHHDLVVDHRDHTRPRLAIQSRPRVLCN